MRRDARASQVGQAVSRRRSAARSRRADHRLRARFAAYKRPDLIFHDPERLARILTADNRPVQIVFAGKAHPADEPAKHHLQQVFKRALDPMFGGRLAFIDDYDLHVAHCLVGGCDVWLNNPRKPLEASGTSGMKASLNGVPHLSIGDGWWAEGFNGQNGWLIEARPIPTITPRPTRPTPTSLYDLLETRSCRRSTIATPTTCRTAGSPWCARRCGRTAAVLDAPHGQHSGDGDGRSADAGYRPILQPEFTVCDRFVSVPCAPRARENPPEWRVFVLLVAYLRVRAVWPSISHRRGIGLASADARNIAVVPTTIATCCISAGLTLSIVSRLVTCGSSDR